MPTRHRQTATLTTSRDAAYDCEWNLHHGGPVVAWCELSDGQFRTARQPRGMLNRVDVNRGARKKPRAHCCNDQKPHDITCRSYSCRFPFRSLLQQAIGQRRSGEQRQIVVRSCVGIAIMLRPCPSPATERLRRRPTDARSEAEAQDLTNTG